MIHMKKEQERERLHLDEIATVIAEIEVGE